MPLFFVILIKLPGLRFVTGSSAPPGKSQKTNHCAEIAISSPVVESCDVSQMTAAATPGSILHKGNEVANREGETVHSL